MSEGERITDGGDYVFEESYNENTYDIIQEKAERLRKLRGKFAIIANSKSGKIMYLQDRKLSNERWWTYFLDCAVGFTSHEMCLEYLKKYRYNKPRVITVTDKMIRDAEQALYSLLYND